MRVRLDTYLWAIRLFKTRTLTATQIKSGKVKLNEKVVKPSYSVQAGETYTINLGGGITKIIEVVEVIDKRQAYEVVKNCYIDHSPPIEKTESLESVFYKTNVKLDKGSGRPTKKNRRDLGKHGGWF